MNLGRASGCRTLPAIMLGLMTPSSLMAAGFQLKENSAVGLGSAFAGAASSAGSPATAFENPAGLTQLPGVQVQLGGTVVIPGLNVRGTSINARGQQNSGADGRYGGNTSVVPNGFITAAISSRLSVGLGLTSPFGLTTRYGSGFIGRYQADKTALETIDLNPVIAYRVTKWLSIGAGLSAQYAHSEFSNYINASAIVSQASGHSVSLPDGFFRLRGESWSVGYNAGVLLQPQSDLNIGLAYRSSRAAGFLWNRRLCRCRRRLNLDNRFRASGGTAKLVLPDTATLSLTERLNPRWTTSAELRWTNWSQFKNLTTYRSDRTLISMTPEHYHNSFFVSVGASYRVNPDLVLRSGIAFDKTPTADAYRTIRVPDQSRYWIAVGLSYKLLPSIIVDVGYAHLFIPNGSIREVSTTSDVLAVRYSSSVDLFSAGTRLTF